jgi:dihydroflavonol-4-reductase
VSILVTGATGFVGAAVARRLVAARCDVRVLVRPDSDRQNLEGLSVTTVTGDLGDPASLDRALSGCHGLYHLAADYRLWVRDPALMYRTNVDGTRAMLEAARRAGIERVVYTSSVATLGTRADGTPADEDTAATLDDMIGHYKRSKYMAEEVVREFVAGGLPVVIVNPSMPVGPRDIKPTPTGRLIVDALTGRMPAFVDTGLNVVHVDDVAEGHLLAYQRGTVGRRYVLGGDDMTLREILNECARIAGRGAPWLELRHDVALPLAYLAEAWARISGLAPRTTVDGVRIARTRMFFSSARAEVELGYRSRGGRAALRDAAAWFTTHGYA